MRALLLLLLVLGLGACKKGGEGESDDGGSAAGDDDDSAREETLATPVRVTPLERGAIAQTIASSATIEAEHRADILVEVTGTIETLSAEEGDRVGVGQVLATLRNPQLQGELERAESAFARAKEQFESLQSLYAQGFVSRNDHDLAAHDFDTAKVTLEQARQSHASRLLTSPIAGIVSSRQIRYGEAVSPGRLAFQVVDLGDLRVDVNLPEKDLARIRPGQKARIRSEVLEGIEASGALERISPVVDPASGTVKVTIALDAGGTALRPGMFVNVELVVDTHEDALLLPKRAVSYEEGEPVAFRVEGTTAKRSPLKLGFAERDRVEILEGLAAGDSVVVVGQSLLRDGAEVRIVDAEADGTDPTPTPSEAPPG